jgi:hypothetical protein
VFSPAFLCPGSFIVTGCTATLQSQALITTCVSPTARVAQCTHVMSGGI